MKKQIRYIIIAGIILAVLIGALVFLLTMPNKEDDGTSTSSSTATTLIEQATGNIEKIVVQNSGGTYTLMGYGAQVESTVESSGETSTVTTTEMVFTMQEHSSYLMPMIVRILLPLRWLMLIIIQIPTMVLISLVLL